MNTLTTLYADIKKVYTGIVYNDEKLPETLRLEKKLGLADNSKNRALIRVLAVKELEELKEQYIKRGGRRDVSGFSVEGSATYKDDLAVAAKACGLPGGDMTC